MFRKQVLSFILMAIIMTLPIQAADADSPVTGLLFWDCCLKSIVDYSFQQRLPGSDNLEEAFRLAAGIPTRITPHVHGANKTDNIYLLDGFNHSDILTGIGAIEVTPEVVDEVDVITGAMPAEYGGGMGGRFNAITRSGTNQWHGRVRLDYVDTGWDEDPDNGYYYSSREYDYMKPTLTLDGPVIKDKLWFLASYSFYSYDFSSKTIGTYGQRYYDDIGLVSVNREHSVQQPFLKLTFRPNDNHLINMVYHSETTCDDNVSGDTGYGLPESFIDQEVSTTAYNFDWDWTVSPEYKAHFALGYIQHKLVCQSGFKLMVSSQTRQLPFQIRGQC